MSTLRTTIATLLAAAIAAFGLWAFLNILGNSFPAPGASATDAVRLGFALVRIGTALAVFAGLVGLTTQVIDKLSAPTATDGPLSASLLDPAKLAEALAKLITAPAGIGVALVLLGLILVIPSAFSTA